ISFVKLWRSRAIVQGQQTAKSCLEPPAGRDHLRCVQTKGTSEMIKNTVIALVTAASLAGVAVPAFADSDIFGNRSPESQAFIADSIVNRLQAQGVNAASVEEWSGLVRAYVELEDGRQAMQLFTPDRL